MTGGLQGGQGGDRPPISSYSVTGNNLTEMSRHASAKCRGKFITPTPTSWLSMKTRQGGRLDQILDVLDRDTDFVQRRRLLFPAAKSETFIRTLTPIDKIPSNKVNKTLQFTEEHLGEHMKRASRMSSSA
ncbi:hypothetical protein PO124_34450 [Bacillus licheniformis]|nr:hypothetical protein [Bacillus licheniformis]